MDDDLRVAADLLQQHGFRVPEDVLRQLLGRRRSVRAILWVCDNTWDERFGSDTGMTTRRMQVLSFAAEECVEKELHGQPPLARWLERGWRIVPGGTPHTTQNSTTTVIVEREGRDHE